MFYVFSKTVGFFAVPSNAIAFSGVIGLLLMFGKHARWGRRLLGISIALLVACGLLPVGAAMTVPLEERFPPWHGSGIAPTGIIILGGLSPERIIAGAELALEYPKARILAVGGNSNLLIDEPPEAELIRQLLGRGGVSTERIELERQSRNTAENAIFSKKVVDPRPGDRWLLVTSALHMPRAMGAFRQAEFLVEAYPVYWGRPNRDDLFLLSSSISDGLHKVDAASREWIGLVYYWTMGRIPDLFPSPGN